MSFVSEFKDFAVKGNVMDMVVGVIIGGAFGKIVTSFISDMVMPPLGLVTGGVNFSDLAITLQEAKREAPDPEPTAEKTLLGEIRDLLAKK